MQPEPSPWAPGQAGLADAIKARVACWATVPQLLSASFDAFELIRLLARQCEDRDPRLFAAFMTTATAAVDGLDAIASAPSLPAPDRSEPPVSDSGQPAADTGADSVTDALAALARVLSSQLARALALAPAAGDRRACQLALRAADEIRHLTARADDHSRPR